MKAKLLAILVFLSAMSFSGPTAVARPSDTVAAGYIAKALTAASEAYAARPSAEAYTALLYAYYAAYYGYLGATYDDKSYRYAAQLYAYYAVSYGYQAYLKEPNASSVSAQKLLSAISNAYSAYYNELLAYFGY